MAGDPLRPELGSEKFTRWFLALRPALFTIFGLILVLLDYLDDHRIDLTGLSALGAGFCGVTLANVIDIARKP